MIRTVLASLLLTTTAASAENVVLVLDASGSMWGQIEGKTKIEIARAAVADLVGHWKADDALGLVAYGHRSKGDCKDIETLIPYGPLDSKAYLATVNKLNPKGMTPLSAAVIQAADSLKISEQKATVILVSDGEETCEMDPCQVGKELEARGVDFTAHVIGFDVPNPAHQAQLRCLAENTGGRYFNVRDAAELRAALGTLASVSTEPALPPASATVQGPASAAAVGSIAVNWTGPADAGDYIAIVQPQGASAREYDYAWAKADAPRVELETPAQAGAWELRYISPRRDPPCWRGSRSRSPRPPPRWRRRRRPAPPGRFRSRPRVRTRIATGSASPPRQPGQQLSGLRAPHRHALGGRTARPGGTRRV